MFIFYGLIKHTEYKSNENIEVKVYTTQITHIYEWGTSGQLSKDAPTDPKPNK